MLSLFLLRKKASNWFQISLSSELICYPVKSANLFFIFNNRGNCKVPNKTQSSLTTSFGKQSRVQSFEILRHWLTLSQEILYFSIRDGYWLNEILAHSLSWMSFCLSGLGAIMGFQSGDQREWSLPLKGSLWEYIEMTQAAVTLKENWGLVPGAEARLQASLGV
jgi:hypothetical protein